MKLKESYIEAYVLIIVGLISTLLPILTNKGGGSLSGLAVALIALAYMSAKYRRVNILMITTFRIGYEFLTVVASLFIVLMVATKIDSLLLIEIIPLTVWLLAFVGYVVLNAGNRENDTITYKPKDTSRVVDESIKDSDLDINKNFLLKLKDGDYGLAKTFWLYGILVNIVFKVSGAFAGSYSEKLFGIVWAIHTIYLIIWIIGLHKSANRYKGSKVWAVLGYIMVIIWALNTLIMAGIVKDILF